MTFVITYLMNGKYSANNPDNYHQVKVRDLTLIRAANSFLGKDENKSCVLLSITRVPE